MLLYYVIAKYEENLDPYLNRNSASKQTEIHLMMTQSGSKHVININVNYLYYYFYLNCCADGYKYTVFNDTRQDATRKNIGLFSFCTLMLTLCKTMQKGLNSKGTMIEQNKETGVILRADDHILI
jgi:hypothetical protein